MTWVPVTWREISAAKYTMAPAISRGSPHAPFGILARKAVSDCSAVSNRPSLAKPSRKPAAISDRVNPGRTALQRIPNLSCAHSTAIDLVTFRTAPLEAQYAEFAIAPVIARTDPRLMIEPPPPTDPSGRM